MFARIQTDEAWEYILSTCRGSKGVFQAATRQQRGHCELAPCIPSLPALAALHSSTTSTVCGSMTLTRKTPARDDRFSNAYPSTDSSNVGSSGGRGCCTCRETDFLPFPHWTSATTTVASLHRTTGTWFALQRDTSQYGTSGSVAVAFLSPAPATEASTRHWRRHDSSPGRSWTTAMCGTWYS